MPQITTGYNTAKTGSLYNKKEAKNIKENTKKTIILVFLYLK